MTNKKKVFTLEDLYGYLVPITANFSREVLRTASSSFDEIQTGVVVDFKSLRVWMHSRHKSNHPEAEFHGHECFARFSSLGADPDERLYVAKLIDSFLFHVAQAERDVSEEEKSLIFDILNGYVSPEVEYPEAVELRLRRSQGIAKVEAVVEELELQGN